MDRKKLLLDVLDLVLKVNGGLATRKGKGHPTAFYDYSGHTNTLYVHIHPDGWYVEKPYTVSHYEEFQFDFDHSDEELERQHERLTRYINELKLEEEEHVNIVQLD